ncbi:MAG: amino acid ABC transporter ATP-binding protein, partial [Firmicutes bacterium]|nr:amino acid ABC transporter ATP-binding protein [Bacillota bacterium]
APGCNINKVRQKMGMVFQSYNLFDHMTVIENLMYAPVKLLGMSRQEAYDRGIDLLKKVGLADRSLKYPDSLSGGQKQRVAIARALAMDPEIILFDEPTSALDPSMVAEVEAVIEDLARSGKTMMIVSHEMSLVKKVASRVFYLDEGIIYEEGTPDQIFKHPQKEKTRSFVRMLRVLEFSIDGQGFDFIGASAEIDNYCIRNHIPPRTANRIRAVVEELCVQILLPEVKGAGIHIRIEYSEEDGYTGITVRYPGKFRPEDSEEDLAYRILMANTEAATYTYDESEGSRIELKLR